MITGIPIKRIWNDGWIFNINQMEIGFVYHLSWGLGVSDGAPLIGIPPTTSALDDDHHDFPIFVSTDLGGPTVFPSFPVFPVFSRVHNRFEALPVCGSGLWFSSASDHATGTGGIFGILGLLVWHPKNGDIIKI